MIQTIGKKYGKETNSEDRNPVMRYILGLACNGTDSAACLYMGGKLLCAVEEERFTRDKHEGRFPHHAIQWCLEYASIDCEDVHCIAISWDYNKYQPTKSQDLPIQDFYQSLEHNEYLIDWEAVERHIIKFRPDDLMKTIRSRFPTLPPSQIRFFRHHDCHAASSYCYSGFDRSLILVMDEKGEDICTSLYLGEGESLILIEHKKLPHSLGLYYAGATQFLNLKPFQDEGTLMALATTGSQHPILWSWLSENVLKNTVEGIELQPEMISKEVFNYPRLPGNLYTDRMIREISKFGIKSPSEIEGVQHIHQDFAFTIQSVFESVILEFLNHRIKKFGVDRLCIAGGVGLNCSLNGKILETHTEETGGQGLFLPPWCHDGGGAIGAAILATRNKNKSVKGLSVKQFIQIDRADWGPSFSDETIKYVLQNAGVSYFRSRDVVRETAQLLADGRIVGWFQGRAEFGPRALGQRSLLSHPGFRDNEKRLQNIKKRLPFRPFAPSILEEHMTRYSEDYENNKFMTTSFKATNLAKLEIPIALNNSDNTLRPQIVCKRKDWKFRELLEEFFKLTNIPALLNTSFNVNEPTVLSPNDALSTFLKNGIDILVIGNFIVMHPEHKAEIT